MSAPTKKESISPALRPAIPEVKEVSPEPVQTFDKIINFAIREKDKTYDLYTKLALKVKNPWTRKAFVKFAAEELRQKERLLKMKSEGPAPPLTEGPSDLALTDYVTAEVVLRSELDTREALLIAITNAQAAKCLYLELAEKATDLAIRVLFRSLALEEAKHKLALETEYDERVFAQN